MDAPGWPESAGGGYVAVVWWALLALVVAAVAVSAYCAVRGPRRGRSLLLGAVLLLAGGVAAVVLYTPPSATVDPTVEGGPAECPFDAVEGARLNVDHDSRMYAFWKPCETASRVRLGTVLGGYALLSGAVVVAMVRTTRGARRDLRGASPEPALTRRPR